MLMLMRCSRACSCQQSRGDFDLLADVAEMRVVPIDMQLNVVVHDGMDLAMSTARSSAVERKGAWTKRQCKESFSWNGIAAAPPLRRGRSNEEVAEIQVHLQSLSKLLQRNHKCVLNDATVQNSDKSAACLPL